MLLMHGGTTVGGLPLWEVALVLNCTIAILYAAIAVTIIDAIVRTGQPDNVLAWATAAIFASCSAGHAVHAAHLVLPSLAGLGWNPGHDAIMEGDAARLSMGGWHSIIPDALTAAAAITYFLVRHRLHRMLQATPSLFRDYREKRDRVLQINDDIVQGLTVAKMAIEVGEDALALEAIDDTLKVSKSMMADFLGMTPSVSLVRAEASKPATS